MKNKLFLAAALSLGLSTWSLGQSFDEAKAAYDKGEYPKAISLFEPLINTPNYANDAAALEMLAHAYRLTANFGKAEALYERLLLNPSAPAFFHYTHALMLRSNGKTAQAKEALERFRKTQPHISQKVLDFIAFEEANRSKQPAFVVSPEQLLNSTDDDYAPLWREGRLFFSSSRAVQLAANAYTDKKTNYLYFAAPSMQDELMNGATLVQASGGLIQNNVSSVSSSPSQNLSVFTYNYFQSGVRQVTDATNYGLKTAELYFCSTGKIEEFSSEKDQPFPHLKGKGIGFASFSPDGKRLYFAANEAPGGQGGFDLYVCEWTGNGWSNPQNLGPSINTPGDEVSPFVSAEGDLYFSSNFLPGFGEFDVYRAKNLGGENWGMVVNLGPGVNSNADDLYFVYRSDNKTGYFSSNRSGGQGGYDLYRGRWAGDENLLLPIQAAPQWANNTKPNNGGDAGPFGNTPAPNNNGNTGPFGNPPAPNNNGDAGPFGNPPAPNNGGDAGPFGSSTWANNDPNAPNDWASRGTPTPPHPSQNKTNPTPSSTPSAIDAACAQNYYIGAVADAQTDEALEGVIVHIFNRQTKQREGAYQTNKYGEYGSYLAPQSVYEISFSKVGYQKHTLTVFTDDGNRKTLLGKQPLLRSATNPATEEWNNPSLNNNQPTVDARYLVDPSRPKPAVAYIVRVTTIQNLDATWTAKLSPYGNLFSEEGNSNKKLYQLGIYADENHAKEVLGEVKKMGFKDAYLSTTPIDNSSMANRIANGVQVVYPLDKVADATPTPSNPNANTNPFTTPTPSNPAGSKPSNPFAEGNLAGNEFQGRGLPQPTSNAVEFRVQLGAYKDPKQASFSKVMDLGRLEQLAQSNGLTYFYLAGYTTFEQANAARSQAKERGVEGPFVVAFRNGQRIDLKEAMK